MLEFIEGQDLSALMKSQRLSIDRVAMLMIEIANAVSYAHSRDLVHRDLKPANVLIDVEGHSHVADFGLAIHESARWHRRGEVSGTPAYMSPEQVRGETHRLDGRSDIWSLGVILYEMLTGRRPFLGDDVELLFDDIAHGEPKPPRQIDPALPPELERICLQCLSKRMTERYSTAADLADDLRRWHHSTSAPRAAASETEAPEPAGVDVTAGAPKIIPKGLRAYDDNDADFFLELLPGARDRDGLPESVRFWKTRLDETDPDKTFSVGLIYGPSGCGKSSLIRAGLLPRLADHVQPVYVESHSGDTAARLLAALRKQCPDVSEDVSLQEMVASLRGRLWLPAGQKIVIVLDQFEQWLHSTSEAAENQLVDALRHCDGERVQCLILVRDDFWLAVSRFMRDLEVPLVEGHNSALADLFDPHHARKVLVEFGRAFGRLPDDLDEMTVTQDKFLDKAISGLCQGGKVIPVHLSLFADMIKGKSWVPETLQQIGGTEGVGVTFLEETFSSRTAPPEHRLHQNAARAVLKALLPGQHTDIKGHMRSYQELLEVSGYSQRRADFDDLLRILDSEIRLITPADPAGMEFEVSQRHIESDTKYYQLTHDYLVPSLHDWLTRKQKETRRGRAELSLAERATLWMAKPENRQLPAWWEWANIRLRTRRKVWTAPQQRMMAKADRYYTLRALTLVVLFTLLGWGIVEGLTALQARSLVRALESADIGQVPAIVKELDGYRRWANPRLEKIVTETSKNSDERLHASLALLPADAGQVDYLYERLLNATPDELPTIRAALLSHKQQLTDDLWAILDDTTKSDTEQKLRAASALAMYEPAGERWNVVSQEIAHSLVSVNPIFLGRWMRNLRPVRGQLTAPLSEIFRTHNGSYTESELSLATNVLADFAGDQPGVLADSLMDADATQFAVLFPRIDGHRDTAIQLLEAELDKKLTAAVEEPDKERLAKRQANAAVALWRMNSDNAIWSLLKHSSDPSVRSWLVHRLGPLGVEAKAIIKRLAEEKEVSTRRALILSLGELEITRFTPDERETIVATLAEAYRDDSDPGIHGAAEWLLRQWGHTENIGQINKELSRLPRSSIRQEGRTPEKAKRQWFVNEQGHTLVVIPGPIEFLQGSPASEAGRSSLELLCRVRIDRTFAIATKDVTIEQFQRFVLETPDFLHIESTRLSAGDDPDQPQYSCTWYEAAAYCRWLSEKEGLAEDQMCYPPIPDIKVDMKMPGNYLRRTGYRLLSGAEFEYASRSGTSTNRYYGRSDKLLEKYAWYIENADRQPQPVGWLKPNDFGLFDTLGNLRKWCQESHQDQPQSINDGVRVDSEDTSALESGVPRVIWGTAYWDDGAGCRCASRSTFTPARSGSGVGFRIARTLE